MEEQSIPTEYYLRKSNGDLLLINFASNRPSGDDWVQITELCYKNLTGGNIHPIGIL